MARKIDNPRELILGEARKILYEEGYSEVSIRRIAKNCNIAVGTIYNYFPTKKELILEMMSSYWQEFINEVEEITKSQEDLYGKLRYIYQEMFSFAGKFKAVWLSREFYESADYVKSGLQREDIFVGRLTLLIEELLKEKAKNEGQEYFDSQKMASFIVMNFILMVQIEHFDYDFFEDILSKVLN